MGSVALVFAGGDPPTAGALRNLPTPDLVIAADSGLEHASAAGYSADLVVGDLDSADFEMKKIQFEEDMKKARTPSTFEEQKRLLAHPEWKGSTIMDAPPRAA